MGCPGRLMGLAAGIVISRCCCSSCCLPTPISGNAESVLETTRGCPAAMMYAPSDVSISKHLHVYRAAAAPHRGGAVIGVQLRYQRMCCTRRRVCRRARADAGRCAIAIWTVAVDADDAAAILHHRRRAAIVAETTGALGVLGGFEIPDCRVRVPSEMGAKTGCPFERLAAAARRSLWSR